MQILKYLIALLCITNLNACGKGLYMLDQPAINIATEKLKQNAKTICLGRFLVDMPGNAIVIAQPYRYVNAFTITTATPDQTRQAILDREKSISEPDQYNLLPERIVKTVSGAKPDSKILVRRLVKTDFGQGYHAGYDMDGYFWMAGKQFMFTSASDSKYLELVLADMLRVIALAKPRAPDEFPTESGFCMEGAYFPGVPENKNHVESAGFYFTLQGHPDVRIEIDTDINGDKLELGLLDRIKENEQKYPEPPEIAAMLAMSTTFHRGAHSVGEFYGEDLLESVPVGPTKSIHSFEWESQGKPHAIYAPNIRVRLRSGHNPNGGPVRPSISDAQAIALFYFVVNSIRIRPDTPAQPVDIVPTTPLGTLCRSGDTCPETGWWEPVPPRGGVRPNPVLFKHGAIMPEKEILFVRRYAWMDDLFGLRKQRVPVQWELWAYPKEG